MTERDRGEREPDVMKKEATKRATQKGNVGETHNSLSLQQIE